MFDFKMALELPSLTPGGVSSVGNLCPLRTEADKLSFISFSKEQLHQLPTGEEGDSLALGMGFSPLSVQSMRWIISI